MLRFPPPTVPSARAVRTPQLCGALGSAHTTVVRRPWQRAHHSCAAPQQHAIVGAAPSARTPELCGTSTEQEGGKGWRNDEVREGATALGRWGGSPLRI